MIQSQGITYSANRHHSPLAYLDPNLPQRIKQYPNLVKSPNAEQHRLRRIVTYGSPTSAQNLHLSCKQNLQPQSTIKIKHNVGNYTVLKGPAPSVKFNKVNIFTASNYKNHKDPSVNFAIQPFTLTQITELNQEKMSEKDFKKIKQLGKGKFGTVWMARHKKTNFLCALKIIKKAVVRQQKVEHQVAKQLRIHNKLRHQNIIAFYGFFNDQENFYIVTQFAAEGHIYGKLRNQHRLQQFQVKDITKQTSDGLRFVHNMGFMHRDIKPENLLVQFGIVKICDFGWAAECLGNQMRKSQCGTPLYYSPELVKNDPHNTLTDVWSLGLLAYELIVGRVPFKIWSEFDLPVILEQQVNIPSYIDASYTLKDFIQKCLTKDQKQRPKLNDLRQHTFLSQGVMATQTILELYTQMKAIF